MLQTSLSQLTARRVKRLCPLPMMHRLGRSRRAAITTLKGLQMPPGGSGMSISVWVLVNWHAWWAEWGLASPPS